MTFDLAQAIYAAPSGQILHIPGGDYRGSFTLDKKLTLLAGVANPVTVGQLVVNAGASGSRISGISAKPTPDIHSDTVTSAVTINGAHDIIMDTGHVTFGLAPDGAVGHGAVAGAPIGRCFTIENATDITIKNIDFSQAFHGIVMDSCDRVTVQGGSGHDMRTSFIVGAMNNAVVINGVDFRSSKPIGNDHADFIHFWIDKTRQRAPMKGLTVTNCTFDQGDGLPILVFNTEDQNLIYGFDDVLFADNFVHVSNTQGCIVENWNSGQVLRNRFHPYKGGDPVHGLPRVIIRAAMVGKYDALKIEGNEMTVAAQHTLAAFPNNTWLSKAQTDAMIAGA